MCVRESLSKEIIAIQNFLPVLIKKRRKRKQIAFAFAFAVA